MEPQELTPEESNIQPAPEYTPTEPTQPPKKKNEIWQFAAELIKTALIVAVLAVTIRAFVIQPFIVEGLSMYPQFHDRDYLLVDKLSYRLHEPRRGDIIVFKYPGDPRVNYVKRVIGLPGETIKIEDSKVTIIEPDNTQEVLAEPYVSNGNLTLVNGKKDSYEYHVPQNSFFVLGDNRIGSSDSRDWGDVPKQDLIGRVLVQAYPLSRFALYPHAKYQ